MGQHLINQFKP